MSDSAKYLGIYLNDHLAGSSFGLSLARRIAKENEGDETGRVLSEVAEEIETDRELLQTLMERLGVRRKLPRQAIAWVGEKAARFKPNGKLIGYSPLSRYIELEALSLGIAGKTSLWEALLECMDGTELAGVDIAELAARGRSQRERVEAQRLRASEQAFGEGLSDAPSDASKVRPSGPSSKTHPA